MWLLQSPVNLKPCGTFSWSTSKSPLSPFSMAAKSLLLPKPRGKKKHSKTSWSSLLSFRTAWSFSPLQNHMDLYLSTCFRASWFTPSFRAAWSLLSPPKPCGPLFPFIRTAWTSIYLLQNPMALFLSPQNLVVLSSFTSEPHGPLSIYLLQNLVVLPFTSEPRGLFLLLLWLPGLGLNPIAHLPLQPHF